MALLKRECTKTSFLIEFVAQDHLHCLSWKTQFSHGLYMVGGPKLCCVVRVRSNGGIKFLSLNEKVFFTLFIVMKHLLKDIEFDGILTSRSSTVCF